MVSNDLTVLNLYNNHYKNVRLKQCQQVPIIFNKWPTVFIKLYSLKVV